MVVGACSTISKRQTRALFPFPSTQLDQTSEKDPVRVDHFLEKKYLENPTDPVRFLTRYRQALLWSPLQPTKACSLWLEIADHSEFPLQELTRLRAMETCAAERGDFDDIKEIVESSREPWLEETKYRAALTRAVRLGDENWEMRLSAEVSRFERLQSEKVKLLKRAVELSEKLGEKELREDYFKRLTDIAPRFIIDPKPEELLSVAADFRRVREFDKAHEMYRKVLSVKELSNTEKLRALDGIRMSYKLDREMEKYLEATREYSEFARRHFFTKSKNKSALANLSRYFNTQLTLARAEWTDNHAEKARQILTRLEKDLKKRIPVEESVLIRARIEEEAGRFKNVVKLLESVNTSRISDRTLRSTILWYRAWNLRKTGQTKQAIRILEELIRVENSPSLIARNRFWLGKTRKEADQKQKSLEDFEWLIANDNIGYYGMLAYRELGRPIPGITLPELRVPATGHFVPTEAPVDGESSALSSNERLMIDWLVAVNENDLGRKYLNDVTADKRRSYSEAQMLDLFKLYARTGSYQTLFARTYELLPEARERVLTSNPDLIFPQPWKATVESTATRFQVPSELVYAIMRQESLFNPLARSPADAFGLLQLIPQSAKKAQEEAKIQIKSHEDLYDPEINILLGTAFIKRLLDRWNGQFVLAVASYNASEKAIAGWIQSRYRGDPLVFIEDIPYEETRNYIKLVMRNYIFYSRLNSGGKSIPFPEACLENIQDAKL